MQLPTSVFYLEKWQVPMSNPVFVKKHELRFTVKYYLLPIYFSPFEQGIVLPATFFKYHSTYTQELTLSY